MNCEEHVEIYHGCEQFVRGGNLGLPKRRGAHIAAAGSGVLAGMPIASQIAWFHKASCTKKNDPVRIIGGCGMEA